VTPERALSEVERLVAEKQKIFAIKLLRERTGLGLKEAKDGVEYFARHGSWRDSDLDALRRFLDSHGSRAQAANEAFAQAVLQDPALLYQSALQVAPKDEAGLSSALRDELRALISAGQKINAIKRFREVFQVGLAEAKKAVEAIAEGREPSFDSPPIDVATAPDNRIPSPLPPRPAEPVSHAGEAAARRLFNERFGETVLAAAPAESGLFKGFVLVSAERVAFVADRYGNWELSEDLLRKDLESVRAKEDPFGYDLVLQSGYHSAHFSELTRNTAQALERLLTGKSARFEPEPEVAHGHATALAMPETAHTAHVVPESLFQAADEAKASEPALRLRFGPQPIVAGVFAAVPVTALTAASLFIPMYDFPSIAYAGLYWAALGLGGALHGHGGVMLRWALVIGLLSWGANYVAPHFLVHAAAVMGLGAAYGSARGAAGRRSFLAIPAVIAESITQIVSPTYAVSTFVLAFVFWLVQFAADRGSKTANATEPALGR
jgi:ribosomal protein L7/L12